MKSPASNLIHGIVNNIVEEARMDRYGISWETITKSRAKGEIQRGVTYGLGNGTTGIVYFLIAYYKIYKDPRLINIIHLALNRIHNHFMSHKDLIGFYNGRGGAIYTLLEGYRVLGNPEYLDKAYELGICEYSEQKVYNLEDGMAGLLLGILHLYGISNRPELTDLIKLLIIKIIAGIKVNQSGIYWDELQISMSPPTGFLFGNSGVVFALRQVSGFLVKPQLFDKVLDEAILFEDLMFSKEECTWKDFINEDGFEFNFDLQRRLNPITKKYSESDFPSTTSFNWGVGSSGMLMVRKDSISRDTLYQLSFEKTKSVLCRNLCKSSSDYTLYRGIGGIWISLMHLGYNFDPEAIINGVNSQKHKYSEFLSAYPGNREFVDLSLFRGECGIGYLLLSLQLANNYGPSVLYPYLDGNANAPKIDFDLEINSLILETNCPLQSTHELNTNTNETFFIQIENRIKQVTGSELNDSTNNFVSIEKFRLLNRKINFRYENIVSRYNYKLEKINPKFLKLARNISLVRQNETILLIRTVDGIQSVPIDGMTYKLLDKCDSEVRIEVSSLLNELMVNNDPRNIESRLFMEKEVKRLILHCIKNGLLRFE